jgi:hypothetical protein
MILESSHVLGRCLETMDKDKQVIILCFLACWWCFDGIAYFLTFFTFCMVLFYFIC